jgi:hypothetical protein
MPRASPYSLASAIVVAASIARAEPPPRPADDARGEARELAMLGDAQFEAGRCDRAIPLWKRAEVKFHAPTILLRIGRCQAFLGKVVEATAMLEAAVKDTLAADAPAPFVEAQKAAAIDLPIVRARVARLEVRVRPRDRGLDAKPEIEIDGVRAPSVEAPFPIDPGDHLIRVRIDSAQWETRVHLDDGERRTVNLGLWSDPPQPRPRTQRTVGFAMGGVGLGAASVGAAFGISALVLSSRLDALCGPDRRSCPAGEQGTMHRLRTFSTLADVGLGVGGTLVAAGVVLVATEPRRRAEPVRLRLIASPLGASIAGAY